VREDENVGAHRHVVVAAEDRVGAEPDLLRRAASIELASSYGRATTTSSVSPTRTPTEYPFTSGAPNLEASDDTTWGVLRLDLGDDGT
jgi:hypothetical protein